MSKDNYILAKTNADAQYKVDKDACSSQGGNANDICVAEAKGKDDVTKADAAYENTPKARQKARVAHAQANYDVAIEKCDDLAGNRKGVFVKEAKAELTKSKANEMHELYLIQPLYAVCAIVHIRELRRPQTG